MVWFRAVRWVLTLVFDKTVYHTTWDEIIKNEIFRQRDKSNNNDIGYFHQNFFSYIHGCEVPEQGWDVIYKNSEGIALPDGEKVHTIYVEMKNKHNTMNSAAASKTYMKMQNQLLQDDDCACFLVEAIAKKSQNIKWVASVDGKQMQHKYIRRASIDQFYSLVTGIENSFYQMCKVLPSVIERVVKDTEDVITPKDSVMDELRQRSWIENKYVDDMSIALAIYLLGFESYIGFQKE